MPTVDRASDGALPRGIRLRRAGDAAILIELDDRSAVHHVAAWLSGGDLGVEDIVPGGATVLVIARTDVRAAVVERLRALPPRDSATAPGGRTLVVPAVYDGPDLAEVCERLGLVENEFVRAHTSIEFVVAYFGFTPGFPYLAELPPALRLPRRPTPRVTIPAGSVAIADELTIIYPGGTPGGWSLVARSSGPPLWDIGREPPNRLSIGDRVVFRVEP